MGVDSNGQLGSESRTNLMNGAVAQLVEQWPEEPRVAGSNPARTTNSEVAQLVRARIKKLTCIKLSSAI